MTLLYSSNELYTDKFQVQLILVHLTSTGLGQHKQIMNNSLVLTYVPQILVLLENGCAPSYILFWSLLQFWITDEVSRCAWIGCVQEAAVMLVRVQLRSRNEMKNSVTLYTIII